MFEFNFYILFVWLIFENKSCMIYVCEVIYIFRWLNIKIEKCKWKINWIYIS